MCLLTTQWIWTIANHNTQLVRLNRVAITWNWNAQQSTHIMQSVRLISIYCWTLEIDFEMNTHESCIIIFIVIGNNLRVHNVNHKQLVNRHNNGIIRHLKHTTQHKRKTTLMLRVFASFKYNVWTFHHYFAAISTRSENIFHWRRLRKER